jgi:NAD+-dependent secondary alcohol dehydrogenase Adh1
VRAVRVHAYNEPPRLEEVPEPTTQGPHDVIVKIGGAGLCRTDLHIIEGQWAEISGVALPYTIGHENAGWVAEVGSAVTNVAVGDTVILHPTPTCGLCHACRAGDDMHCANSTFPGIDSDGGMAEYLRTHARACIKLEDGTNPQDVAALADAGITAYHAVRKAMPLLHPGTHCVVVGAGGLGHIGIQSLAALTATEITVVDPNPGALELAEQIGAHHTVLADGSQVDQVAEISNGGAQVVLDFVGEGGAEKQAPSLLRNGGSHFVIGYGGALDLDTIAIVSREINVIGNLVGTYNDLVELMNLAQRGLVTLHTQTYSLDDVHTAIADLENGRIRGRGILVP